MEEAAGGSVPVATAAHFVVQRAVVRRPGAVVVADMAVTDDAVCRSRQRGGVGWRSCRWATRVGYRIEM